MKKKFLAGVLLACMFCSPSYAKSWYKVDWDKVGDYFTEKMDDAAGHVAGWFGKNKRKEPPVKNDEILPQHLAKDWDELTEDLNETLRLRDKQERLPRRSWIPFKEDQKSNAKRINEILDEAMRILVSGPAGDMRRETTEIRSRIARQRVELDEMRNKRINAPENSYMFWKLTKDKADKRIAELEREISNNEKRLASINLNLTTELGRIGLELEPQQTEILLNSVTGDDLLKNTIIFSNIKIIVAKLENLAQNDTNSYEINRRYTGMYLVLNDLLIHTQEEFVRQIDGGYTPKLSAIISEAEKLRQDALTKSKNNSYTKAQREAFTANVRANDLTIQVANLYGKLLNSQRASTVKSIESMKRNRDVAENTYKTVKSSGELRGLIHSGLSLFDAIDGMTMPELKIFENGAMRLEFEEINRRLKN